MRFDWTITLGNAIATLTFIFSGIAFIIAGTNWRKDIEWRVSNLETWRKEHIVDAESRDAMIQQLTTIVDHVRWQTDWMNGKRGAIPPKT